MAVINALHLLVQADELLQNKHKGLVRQANRRRAISSAYYAVFHTVLAALADEFIGYSERRSLRYALAYRAVDHNKLSSLCNIVVGKNNPQNYRKYLPENGFNESVKQFSALLIELKEKRNLSDYDPSHWVRIIDAQNAINSAREAIIQFHGAAEIEKQAFLTLLAFPPR